PSGCWRRPLSLSRPRTARRGSRRISGGWNGVTSSGTSRSPHETRCAGSCVTSTRRQRSMWAGWPSRFTPRCAQRYWSPRSEPPGLPPGPARAAGRRTYAECHVRGGQTMIHPAELIERKRDGEELTEQELTELVVGYTAGDVPDSQMSAFCMAVVFRGLSAAETLTLTDVMVQSGETIDLSAKLSRKVVDKHSTGGVGDKTSIAVGPLVAACGVPFA